MTNQLLLCSYMLSRRIDTKCGRNDPKPGYVRGKQNIYSQYKVPNLEVAVHTQMTPIMQIEPHLSKHGIASRAHKMDFVLV